MDIFPGAKLMQVAEWGYYMGSLRPAPRPDQAFSVVHITANLATAENEAGWRINDPALQNSATFFNNRDGSTVQLLGDPATMDPWANGDMNNPDVSNPRIAAVVRDGVNPNERTLLALENVGNEIAWGKVPGGYPITPEQELTCARQIAHYHTRNGVPINRETVVGHYQLNSVSRPNCPSRDKSILDRIVAMAQRIEAGIAAKEDEMFLTDWLPVEEDWVTGSGAGVASSRVESVPALGEFWTGGPGQGEAKFFNEPYEFHSFAESRDGRWRLGVALGIPEVLCVHRNNLRLPHNRRPATGYGYELPTAADDGVTQATVDQAIADLNARIDAAQRGE